MTSALLEDGDETENAVPWNVNQKFSRLFDGATLPQQHKAFHLCQNGVWGQRDQSFTGHELSNSIPKPRTHMSATSNTNPLQRSSLPTHRLELPASAALQQHVQWSDQAREPQNWHERPHSPSDDISQVAEGYHSPRPVFRPAIGALADASKGSQLSVVAPNFIPQQDLRAQHTGLMLAHAKFERQEPEYFEPGVVFQTYWPEPLGWPSLDDASATTYVSDNFYTKRRTFVVIEQRYMHCRALPIHTYRGLGVAKDSVKKSQHVIIYTSQDAPLPTEAEMPRRPGEQPMKSDAIRILASDRTDKLHPMSRLNLGMDWPIQNNIKVRDFGRVHKDDLPKLWRQHNQVDQEWKKRQRRLRKKVNRLHERSNFEAMLSG